MHPELDRPGMWPQPEIPLGDQRSQPPLARSYLAASVIYCQLDHDQSSRGNDQHEWWHDFCLKTQAVLKRYGAVTAERDSWGLSCALRLGESAEKTLGNCLKPVQCALQLLSCIRQLELPGKAHVRAKIGVHTGEALDSLVGGSNTLHYRPYGQTYDVARQLAECASWGGMLVSEHVWEEQGPHARLWVYNQGVSMPWGPVISCFALLPEGHAAYLHSNALPTLVTRGIGIPTTPCHSTAWQFEGAPLGGSTGTTAPRQLLQSVRPQPLPAEPLNPFDTNAAKAIPHASCQTGAVDHSISQLHQLTMKPQPAMTATGGPSPPDSVASSLHSTEDHRRHYDEWLTQRSPTAQQAPSSTWGTDSAEAFPEIAHADMLGLSPSSRHSGSHATMEESLDSASALQPRAPTFAELLQQQKERAARSRAALGTVGPSGALGSLSRLSASQMAHALSALPKLSGTERMARFMAALQDSRPRGAFSPAAHFDAPVLPSSHSKQLLHGLSEVLGAQNSKQAVKVSHPHSASTGPSQRTGGGDSASDVCMSVHEDIVGLTPTSADSALPTLGANPCPHPWPEQFIAEGNWFSQEQHLKPGQGSGTPGISCAPLGEGWGPDRKPWPQGWGAGKPGQMAELSSPVLGEGRLALHGPNLQQRTWIGVTASDAMTGNAIADLAAGSPAALEQREQSLGPVRLSELGDLGRCKAQSAQGLSTQPAGQSLDNTPRSGGWVAPEVPGMQEPLHFPWPDAAAWQPSMLLTDATPQLPDMPHGASKVGRAPAVPQVPGSSAPAGMSWDPAGAFEAYWDHLKNYSSNVPTGTRSMYWDHVKATSGIAQSGACSKAIAQKPSHPGGTPAAKIVQQPLQQHVKPLTQQQQQLSGVAAKTQPHDESSLGSSAASAPHLELAQRQSSHSSAHSQRDKTGWSQQPPSVLLPPLQPYETNQMVQTVSIADTGGLLPGSMTAAQQLSSHDVIRRNWVPGSTLHVTWQEDRSFMPTEERKSSASSLASFRSTARSMLSGTAMEVFHPAAGAQLPASWQQAPAAEAFPPAAGALLPVSWQQASAASMSPPSVPATSTLPGPSTANPSPAVERCAMEDDRLPEEMEIARSRLKEVQRSPKQAEAPSSVWVRLAAAFWAQLLGNPGTVTSLRLPSGKVVRQSATLEFMNPRLERRFQNSWAARKVAHDKAVLIFLIIVTLGVEIADIAYGHAPQVHHVLPGLGTAAVMGAMLAAMVLRPAWYLSHRAGLQLLLRILRAISLNWHVKQAASGVSSPGRTLMGTFVRSGFPLAVLSLCDGNTMGPHIVGDLVCVLLAAAQAPWLCSTPCSFWTAASSTAWLAARAAMLVVLCSAVLFSIEEVLRRAFIEAMDGDAKPVLAPRRASRKLLDPTKLFMTTSGRIRCGRHASILDS